MKWVAFKDEIPETGRLILYGNHRFVETALYNPEHPRIKEDGKLAYKNITHWCYIETPPVVPWGSEWKKEKS